MFHRGSPWRELGVRRWVGVSLVFQMVGWRYAYMGIWFTLICSKWKQFNILHFFFNAEFLLLLFCQFLDTVTGTYRYYHSPTNRVHLYPPEVTIPQTPPSTPPTAKQKPTQPAQPDASREREREQSKLKRSYSSPDISQDLREEAQKKAVAPPAAAVIPTINRDTK